MVHVEPPSEAPIALINIHIYTYTYFYIYIRSGKLGAVGRRHLSDALLSEL